MRVLYTHTSALIGGGNRVLLRLFKGMDRSLFQPVSIIPEPGPLERELRLLDVPSLILDLRPDSWRRGSLPARTARLALEALRHRVRLLHANDPWTYRVASVGLSLPWIRRICHIHHPLQEPYGLRWSLRRQPRLVITPSHFMRELVANQIGPDQSVRTETVWNPIDVDRFQPVSDVAITKSRLALDPGWRNITILGALAPHKGHECFIRMADIVRRLHPSARFHVVGGAQSGNQHFTTFLQRMVADLHLEEHVRFWGFVSDRTVQDLLGISDLSFCRAEKRASACRQPRPRPVRSLF